MGDTNLLSIEKAMGKVKSKFKLVTILAKRAKMLRENKGKYVESQDEHYITKAANEIISGELKLKDEEKKAKE